MQCVESRQLLSMRITRVDRVASSLAAAMLLVGIIVSWLSLVWLMEPRSRESQQPMALVSAGSQAPYASSSSEIAEPSEAVLVAEEFSSELSTALSSIEFVAEKLNDSESVTPSEQPASLPELGARGDVAGELSGISGAATHATPIHQRWQIVFQATDLKDYARQLDYFAIELGCVGGGIAEVEYASHLSTQPVRRSGAGGLEKRLHFSWRGVENAFSAYDRQLLQAVGIRTSQRLTLRFIPIELQQELAQLELEYAWRQGRSDLSEVTQTVFRSVHQGKTFSFEVAAQLTGR